MQDQCVQKMERPVDTFRRKIDKSGSGGAPISDRAAQWRFL